MPNTFEIIENAHARFHEHYHRRPNNQSQIASHQSLIDYCYLITSLKDSACYSEENIDIVTNFIDNLTKEKANAFFRSAGDVINLLDACHLFNHSNLLNLIKYAEFAWDLGQAFSRLRYLRILNQINIDKILYCGKYIPHISQIIYQLENLEQLNQAKFDVLITHFQYADYIELAVEMVARQSKCDIKAIEAILLNPLFAFEQVEKFGGYLKKSERTLQFSNVRLFARLSYLSAHKDYKKTDFEHKSLPQSAKQKWNSKVNCLFLLPEELNYLISDFLANNGSTFFDKYNESPQNKIEKLKPM